MENDTAKKIRRRNRKLEKEQKNIIVAVRELQKTCSHLNVVECPYESNTFLSTLEPLRLCKNCGIEEEGWGASYYSLRDNEYRTVEKVSRNDLYKMRMPGGRYLWARCYGDKNHAIHACPREQLTKAHHTRCFEYSGFFED